MGIDRCLTIKDAAKHFPNVAVAHHIPTSTTCSTSLLLVGMVKFLILAGLAGVPCCLIGTLHFHFFDYQWDSVPFYILFGHRNILTVKSLFFAHFYIEWLVFFTSICSVCPGNK